MYVVAEANNTDYEILISEPFKTREEARKYMEETYLKTISIFDLEYIAASTIEEDSYRILLYNCDLYYGQIKELKEG